MLFILDCGPQKGPIKSNRVYDYYDNQEQIAFLAVAYLLRGYDHVKQPTTSRFKETSGSLNHGGEPLGSLRQTMAKH